MRMCVSSIRSTDSSGQVELVLDLADDLLEQVLERDDPLHRAVLVDDDRHVLVLRRNSASSAARSFVSGTM